MAAATVGNHRPAVGVDRHVRYLAAAVALHALVWLALPAQGPSIPNLAPARALEIDLQVAPPSPRVSHAASAIAMLGVRPARSRPRASTAGAPSEAAPSGVAPPEAAPFASTPS